MIFLQLFWSFFQIGLFSIGGGYAALPLIQAQVVDTYGWMTMTEFTDIITISQMTPGPIAINAATFVGTRIAGPAGAAVATFSCIFVVALIASAGLSILVMAFFPAGEIVFSADAVDILALFIFAAAFAVLRIWKPNPIWVMCGAGAAGLILYSIF